MDNVPVTTAMGPAEALARLAGSRDALAWAALVEGLAPAMQRLAARLTGSASLADDAVQDALLQIRDGAGRFRPLSPDADTDARRWIMRVLANAALNLVTRGHVRRARSLPAELGTAGPAPDAALHQAETARLVRAELAALPESTRGAVVLHHLEGLAYAEVALAMGCSEGAARVRVLRGLRRMRDRLRLRGFALSLAALVTLVDGLPGTECVGGADYGALLGAPPAPSLAALPGAAGLGRVTMLATAAAVVVVASLVVTLWWWSGSGPRPASPAGAGVLTAIAPAASEHPVVAAELLAAGGEPLALDRIVAVLRRAIDDGRVARAGLILDLPAARASWDPATVDAGGPVTTSGCRLEVAWQGDEEHWLISCTLPVRGEPLRLAHRYFDGTPAVSYVSCERLRLRWVHGEVEWPSYNQGLKWIGLLADRTEDIGYELAVSEDGLETRRQVLPRHPLVAGGSVQIELGFGLGGGDPTVMEALSGIQSLMTAPN